MCLDKFFFVCIWMSIGKYLVLLFYELLIYIRSVDVYFSLISVLDEFGNF